MPVRGVSDLKRRSTPRLYIIELMASKPSSRTKKYWRELDSIISETVLSQAKIGYKLSKNIYLTALSKYFSNEIDEYSLSSIASLLYFQKNSTYEINSTWDSEFAGLLSSTFELEYYKKKSSEDGQMKKRYEHLVQENKKFLAKHS